MNDEFGASKTTFSIFLFIILHSAFIIQERG
jgi:hypothetical protein